MSVVPPEFTSGEVHSDPVTGMTGGAFPPRGSKVPSPMTQQGLAPSVPSLQLWSKATVPLQSLILPLTVPPFFISVKRQFSYFSSVFSTILSFPAENQKPPPLGGGFWCVLCVF